MPLPVSAIILTYNEEVAINECLTSLCGFVDQIVVVDSGSKDKTLEIAKHFTSNIYHHVFENYAEQRNWAQENVPLIHDWVLHLDAGERLTPELKDALQKRFQEPLAGINGFIMPRRTVFIGVEIRHGGHYPSYHLRLFRKQAGRCEDRLYDQHFYISGTAEIINADIIDVVAQSVEQLRYSITKWAKLEAMEVLRTPPPKTDAQHHVIQGNRIGTVIEKKRWLRQQYYALPLFIRPFLYFFYRFFIKKGFLDGKYGVIFHVLQGFWFRWLVDVSIIKGKSI